MRRVPPALLSLPSPAFTTLGADQSCSTHTHSVRGKPHAWTPAACLASARELLTFLHGSVSTHPSTLRAEADLRARASAGTGAGAGAGEDDPAAWPVFRVVFSPQEGVSVRELTPREVHDEVLGAKRAVHGGRVGFLLARWVREVRERRARLEQARAQQGCVLLSPLTRPRGALRERY